MAKKVIRLNENDIENIVKKILKESMNLSQGAPYINLDDDEIDFVQPYLEQGNLELHGNQLYYNENNRDIMDLMVNLFPNDFDDDFNKIGFTG